MSRVYFTEKDYKNMLSWHDLAYQKRETTQEQQNTRTKLLAFLITTQEETIDGTKCNLDAIR